MLCQVLLYTHHTIRAMMNESFAVVILEIQIL